MQKELISSFENLFNGNANQEEFERVVDFLRENILGFYPISCDEIITEASGEIGYSELFAKVLIEMIRYNCSVRGRGDI